MRLPATGEVRAHQGDVKVMRRAKDLRERSDYILKGPLLCELFGMSGFMRWALGLMNDLANWKTKSIPWSEVSRSAIVVGPPGTGKNLAIRALAATCGLPLITTSYAQWQLNGQGCLGGTLAAMREVFRLAEEWAPCIIFIDAFETVGSRAPEETDPDTGALVISALNEEMNELAEGVVLVAAAHVTDGIAKCLLRSGRLDTKITLSLPSEQDREGIIRFYLKDDLANTNLSGLVAAMLGMSGADIERVVRVSRQRARQSKRPLQLHDLFAILGEKIQELPPKLLYRVAVHEAGHAIAAIALNVSHNVSVSVFQAGKHCAVTNFDPRVEAVTRAVVDQRIAVALAGRAAEKVLLGDVTAGAGGDENSDLGIATGIAGSAVLLWGLSSSSETRWGLAPRPAILDEVNLMLDTAYDRAIELIRDREWQVRAVADTLVKRRALAHDDIIAVMARTEAGAKKGSGHRRPQRKE
jgi:cell division protease FtsH